MSSPPPPSEADLPEEGPPTTEGLGPANTTEAAEDALRTFAEEADLDLALIVDPSGALIAGITSDPGISTEGMGTLVSDSASMAKTLAEQLGDGGPIESFHQTQDFSLYLRELENRLMLVGRGKADAPAGLVREVAARSGREVTDTLSGLEVGEFPPPTPEETPQAIPFPPPIQSAEPESSPEGEAARAQEDFPESDEPPSLTGPDFTEEPPPSPLAGTTAGVALSELSNLAPRSPGSYGTITSEGEESAPDGFPENAPEDTAPPPVTDEPETSAAPAEASDTADIRPIPAPAPFSEETSATEVGTEPEPVSEPPDPAPEPAAEPVAEPDPSPPVLVSPEVVDSPFEAVDDDAEEEEETPAPSILDEPPPHKPGPRYSFDLG